MSTNPATLLGFGTWAAFGAGRMLLGWNTGDSEEATGGAATHSHAFTQPDQHAALTHSAHAGATVGDHAAGTTGAHSGSAAKIGTSSSSAAPSPHTHSTPGLVHTVGQASAHSDHAAMTHAGGAVVDGATTPPYVIVRMWKRTA